MSSQPGDRARSPNGPGGSTTTMPRSIIVLLGILGVVALGIGTKAAAGIIAPTMLALVLTIAVLPIGRWARKHGWPSWLATLTALVAAYLILLVMVIGSVVCLIKFADLLPSYAAEAKDLTKDAEDGLAQLGLSTGATSDALSKLDPTKLADVAGRADLRDPRSPRLPVLPGDLDVLLRRRRAGLRTAHHRPPAHQARAGRGHGQVPEGFPDLPAGDRALRRHRRRTGCRCAVAAGRPAPAGLGVLLVPHELHPQHRLRHRHHPARPAGVARRRAARGCYW